MWCMIMKNRYIFSVKLMQDLQTVMTPESSCFPVVCPDTKANSFDKAIWPGQCMGQHISVYGSLEATAP